MPTVKWFFGRSAQIVEDCLDHSRSKLLRTQTVAAANNQRHLAERSDPAAMRFHGALHIEIKRVATRAGFFRPVEHCDVSLRFRYGSLKGVLRTVGRGSPLSYRFFTPIPTSSSTVSCAASAPEPIMMTTRSAFGWPTYWKSS